MRIMINDWFEFNLKRGRFHEIRSRTWQSKHSK
jgi:hypothetical protein